eukprot:Sspe_Gene.24408::Locus_9672_Transcript_10_10_Confidence_0.400_Length_1296::g.24408::m.24408
MARRSRPSIPDDVDALLSKHAITKDEEFLTARNAPNPTDAKKKRKEEKLVKKATLTKWGGMKKGDDSVEARQALKLVRLGNFMTDKHYIRPAKERIPEYYEFGEEIGSKTDLNLLHERTKKKRNVAKTMVKEILRTAAAQQLIHENVRGKKEKEQRREKMKLRRNKAKINAKKKRKMGAGL